MKRLVVCVFAMTAAALAVDVSWTGAGGDHSWSNPANWSTGTVPDKHDNVTIPSGTPFCNAPATIELGSLTNAGTLVGNPDPWHGTYLKTDGDVQNTGTIACASSFTVKAGGSLPHPPANIGNSGVMNATNVSLHGNIVTNSGQVLGTGGGSITPGVSIWGANVINNGTIKTSSVDAGDASTVHIMSGFGVENSAGATTQAGNCNGDNGNGGKVSVFAGGCVNNSGDVIAGNSGMVSGEPGKADVTAGQKVYNHGTITGGQPSYLQPGLTDERGDVVLAADTIELAAGCSIDGDTLRFVGRRIAVAGLSFRGIAADGVSLWYSTAGGAVDFSGTHTQNAIWCDGGSSIHGDQITAPPEGLGYIFNPDPDSLPADTTVLGVWVSGAEASGAPGTADSAVVLMQNLSTGAHTLQYSFWSARAWVEPAGGGVGPLVPFAVCSLFVHFVVPAGAEPGNQDTVFLVVSIGPAYAETCLSTITCTGEPPGTREQSQGPVSGWFRVQSPFKGRAAAVYELAARSLVSVVVYDAVGRQVRVLLRGFAEPGRGTLKWDGKDESGRVMPAGAYVLRFESGAVCAAANLLKLE